MAWFVDVIDGHSDGRANTARATDDINAYGGQRASSNVAYLFLYAATACKQRKRVTRYSYRHTCSYAVASAALGVNNGARAWRRLTRQLRLLTTGIIWFGCVVEEGRKKDRPTAPFCERLCVCVYNVSHCLACGYFSGHDQPSHYAFHDLSFLTCTKNNTRWQPHTDKKNTIHESEKLASAKILTDRCISLYVLPSTVFPMKEKENSFSQ